MLNHSLFEFVEQFSSDLAELAYRIENQLFDQPHASMMQARLYSEELVKIISKEEELENIYPLKHAEKIHKLYRQNAIEEDIYMKLEWIRKKGNKATHDVKEVEIHDALQAHKFLFEISVWYMQVYVNYNFEPPIYKLPIKSAPETNPLEAKDIDDLIKPYLNQTLQKIDDMWSEIQQQIEAIREEKGRVQTEELLSKAVNIHQSEVAATAIKEPSKGASNFRLQFKNETLVVTGELSITPIIDLPVNGCSHLLRELSRIGIDSLLKITTPMDTLHMKLNGVGPHTIEKFWRELVLLQGRESVAINEEAIKMSNVIEKLYKVFLKNHFHLINKTAKAAEFENVNSKEVVYLLPNKDITIVMNPNTVENHSSFKSENDYHSTALKKFPKKIKNGKTPTNYGYAFKFKTEGDLDLFLNRVDHI
ncbi:DUF4145 domain-containing protein [Bacillus sp. FJAT-53711]|uniref:DUF4145 domain-containing protein n=1 Tax=Bacillus yunxiaonensis TaxID=3127665 RepID=A0ABU8G0L6_9BACI